MIRASGGRGQRTLAIVMRRTDFGESSRIVQLCTRRFGILSFLARGAHRPKSAFLGALDLLHVGEARVRLRPGRGLSHLYRLEILQGNRAFWRDGIRRSLAYQMTELVRRLWPEGQPEPALFDLYQGALSLFAGTPPPFLGTVEVGIKLRLLRCLGVLPSLDTCPQTSAPLPVEGKVGFLPKAGGFVHPSVGGRLLPAALPRLGTELLRLPGKELARHEARPEALRLLHALLLELLKWQLGEELRVKSPYNLFAPGKQGARIRS